MPDFQLYCFAQSGNAYRAALMLNLIGADWQPVYVDFFKGGVRLLSKSVALHGARLNPQVRCNSIHPAYLEGPMVDTMLRQSKFPDAARARITPDIPLGRLGTAAEVADLCIYLLSDESRFVTGAEFVIDGGLTAR